MGATRVAMLVGQRFGALTVIAEVEATPSGRLWRCRCDCGGERMLLTTKLKSTQNPGCKNCEYDRRGAVHRTHGESGYGIKRSKKSKLYMVWKGMHSRCRDPGNTSYSYYGGKGIKVSDAWSSYEAFRFWAVLSGYHEGLSIDRRSAALDYAPENCEWVTRSENSRRAGLSRRVVA